MKKQENIDRLIESLKNIKRNLGEVDEVGILDNFRYANPGDREWVDGREVRIYDGTWQLTITGHYIKETDEKK